MDKKSIKAFVQECIDEQDWEARFKANHIEMNEWFKYSGEVEEDTPVHQFESQRSNRFVYDENKRCHTLHEIRNSKIYKNNENNGNP